MADTEETFLSGGNIGFIEELYARYLEDPASVDPSWREIFDRNRGGEPIVAPPLDGRAAAPTPAIAPVPAAPPEAAAREGMELQARVDQLVYAFRLRGHLLAKLDPLGRPRPKPSHAADLAMIDSSGFSEEELRREVSSSGVFPEPRVRLGALIDRLRQTYCEHVGVEFMTLLDSERRRWLMPRMEHTANRADPLIDEQRRVLTRLSYAETFEQFLHTKYVGAKRFSLDGADALIPMLDTFLDESGRGGAREVVIGMAHRGRLNVLTNILGKSPDEVFSEFEGGYDARSFMSRGDVKYHRGFSSDYDTAGGARIHLSLSFNPSHLEAVDPVVVGRVRSKQDRAGDAERHRIASLLIHGDAAFTGQGVVAETLNLARLRGYDVGGTVHVVVNNQLGFTTEPEDTHSAPYCTAPAQMLDVPIFHVNGDDAEACVHVMRLATQYRQQFHSDVVVDLVCYRRYGHNEGDEPTFTQPQMYQLIRKHPTARQLYAAQLAEQGRIPAEEADRIRASCLDEFSQALARAREKSRFQEIPALEGVWQQYRGGADAEVPQPDTGVDRAHLSELLRRAATAPDGFHVHPTLQRFLKQRHEMADRALALDWSAGETLAYASLLADGRSIRLTGQDAERGTFSHRHAVLHDVQTGGTYVPLQHLAAQQGQLQIFNSPLSEMGCLGFEYGYSLDAPDALVIWEAQFGDFSNGAQVVIDQFLVAAERKWRRLSGLVLLLPHGYEGQGPEHSSARLERFLELCADDNIQVCYPTTPAQIFHLLRRQVVRPLRKPLVVMSPKSLLRRPEATSPLDALAQGRFARLLADDALPMSASRLLLCSGKIYYDLAAERARRKDASVALARVEQLYPFPSAELAELLGRLPALREIYWVQEEPKNMGAWRYMLPLLQGLIAERGRGAALTYVGRAESASPATGFEKAHRLEQQLIVEQALSRGAT